MKKNLYHILFLFGILLCHIHASAQTAADYKANYKKASSFLRDERFSEAMSLFLPLTSEKPANEYFVFASYNYAVAAFKNGSFDQAKMMLLQILDKYPAWPKIDDTHYLLANTYFELKEYDKAIAEGNKVNNEVLAKEAAKMKEYYINKFRDVNLLKKLAARQPNDAVIIKILNERLAKNAEDQAEVAQSTVAQVDINSDQMPEPDRMYHVALVLPIRSDFPVNSKEAKDNQFVFDLIQGINLAADSLKRAGLKFEISTYDTRKDTVRFNEMIKSPELKQMDLIIGPIFNTASDKVVRFANDNKIVMVNPLSSSTKVVGRGSYNYLYRSTSDTQAKETAEFAKKAFAGKNAIVFFSGKPKDSLFALAYQQYFTDLGGKVKLLKKVTKANSFQLSTILTKRVLDSTSHILMLSADPTVASNLINTLEVTNTKTPVITTDDWLEFETVDFNQYQSHQFYFIYPDFVDGNRQEVINFKNKFTRKYHMGPSIYANLGYDMLLFYGDLLIRKGPNLQKSLVQSDFTYGATLPGIDFSASFDNKFVPIVKFENYKIKVVNFPIIR